MAKISDAVRQALIRRKSDMDTSFVIRNKTFTTGIFRMLPLSKADKEREQLAPGIPVTNLFSSCIGKKGGGSTSPRTFGQRDPVLDWLDRNRASWSKEKREEIRKLCNYSNEVLVPVVDRSNMGTAKAPRVRGLGMKGAPYGQITDAMTDLVLGCDIIHPDEGRDFRYEKAIVNGDTRYTVVLGQTGSRLGQVSPDAPNDPAMHKALLEAADTLDLMSRVPRPNWQTIQEIYTALTGETVPQEYLDQDQNVGEATTDAAEPESTDAADGSTVLETPAGETAPVVSTPSTPNASAVYAKGQRVIIVVDDTQTPGVVTEVKKDENGDALYAVTGDDQQNYDVFPDYLIAEPVEAPKPKPAPAKKPAPKPQPAAKKPAPKPQPAAKGKASEALKRRLGKR